MVSYSTLCFTIALFVFCTTPIIESLRCSQEHEFKHWLLNSTAPFNFFALRNGTNESNYQRCTVRLAIDYTTGLSEGLFQGLFEPFNGSHINSSASNSNFTDPVTAIVFPTDFITAYAEDWFRADNQSSSSYDLLHVITYFSLTDNTKVIHFIYQCSMSDYCDIDFVRETFSTPLPVAYVHSFHQNLTNRLHHKNNNESVQCSSKDVCPDSTPLCSLKYSRNNGIFDYNEKLQRTCVNATQLRPIFVWLDTYSSSEKHNRINIGLYDCNTRDCGSDKTIAEIIQAFTHEYHLPVNNSITDSATTTDTTLGNASNIIGHLYITLLCSLIILFHK